MTTTNRKDCCTEITKAIIADLEKGIRPWVKPWVSGAKNACRPLRSTGEAYRGINVLCLWRAADLAGYKSPHWFTYRQAQDLGGQVRRGEKSTPVLYANLYQKTEDDDAREPEEKRIPFLKAYAVFNADQIENLPAKFSEKASPDVDGFEHEPNKAAVEFFANTGAAIREDRESARYSVLEDTIYMPPFRAFEHADRYYSTLAHELTHWTGHPKRSPRIFPKSAYTPQTYAREELVAELGAAFLCADLGINLTPRPDHADYIGNWLQVLRNDKRAIFQAASYAQRAADYLHSLQPQAIKQAA
jgi:antirestriction protein ArdC